MSNNEQKAAPGLPGFKTLHRGTYLYTPDASTKTISNKGPKQPDLILLTSWMNASLRNVVKYTNHYQRLYPASSILAITSSSNDFFFNTPSKQQARFAPVVAAIRAIVETQDSSAAPSANAPEILVHSLSNGGTGQLSILAKQYLEVTGTTLPATAMIYDSAPGKSRFKQGMNAFSVGLPKNPLINVTLRLIIALLLAVCYTIPAALGYATPADIMRKLLNSTDPEYLRKEAPRCYIYSDADMQILDHDVEDHANDAEARGFDVRRQKFLGTPHVDHMRTDPERYWKIVQDTWETRA